MDTGRWKSCAPSHSRRHGTGGGSLGLVCGSSKDAARLRRGPWCGIARFAGPGACLCAGVGGAGSAGLTPTAKSAVLLIAA